MRTVSLHSDASPPQYHLEVNRSDFPTRLYVRGGLLSCFRQRRFPADGFVKEEFCTLGRERTFCWVPTEERTALREPNPRVASLSAGREALLSVTIPSLFPSETRRGQYELECFRVTDTHPWTSPIGRGQIAGLELLIPSRCGRGLERCDQDPGLGRLRGLLVHRQYVQVPGLKHPMREIADLEVQCRNPLHCPPLLQ